MGSSKNVISEPVDAEEGYNMMVRHSVAIILDGIFSTARKTNFSCWDSFMNQFVCTFNESFDSRSLVRVIH